MDNSKPTAWADSDESNKSTWQTFSFTDTYTNLPSGNQDDDELHIFAGRRCPHRAAQPQLRRHRSVAHGSGNSGWLCQGTHHQSDTINGEFHVISTGHGDNKAKPLRAPGSPDRPLLL